jgi:hypothetical protein
MLVTMPRTQLLSLALCLALTSGCKVPEDVINGPWTTDDGLTIEVDLEKGEAVVVSMGTSKLGEGPAGLKPGSLFMRNLKPTDRDESYGDPVYEAEAIRGEYDPDPYDLGDGNLVGTTWRTTRVTIVTTDEDAPQYLNLEDGDPNVGRFSWSGSTEGGGDEAIASCTDENACIEITGGDAAAFKAQCDGEGNQGSTSPCPSNSGGPTCLGATITSSGVRLPANVYWHANFCSLNPHIDTRTTCTVDLGGSPSGAHCSGQ